MAEKLFGKTVRKKEVFYDGFAVGEIQDENVLSGDFSVNCHFENNKLVYGTGVKPYEVDGVAVQLPGAVQGNFFIVWDSDANGNKRERIGYITEQNNAFIHLKDSNAFSNIGALNSGAAAVSAIDKDGKNTAIFVCELGICRLEERKLVLCDETPCQPIACFCGGRVFAVTKDFRLMYSAPFAPTDYTANVDDSGAIILRHDAGKIVGLTALKNRLCVLYEYGISMIDLDGTARSFVRKDVEYSGGRIFGETVCVANVSGEKAYFLAAEGIYLFDGIRVEKICKNLAVYAIVNTPCGRAVCEGKYYVTFTDENYLQKTVCVDLESGLGEETFPMYGLYSVNGKAVCRYRTNLYVLSNRGELPSGIEAVFQALKTNFSVSGSKTLTALRFVGEGSFELQVSIGKKSKTQTVVFQDGFARVPIGLRGYRFSLTVKPLKGTEIRNMTAELQMLV